MPSYAGQPCTLNEVRGTIRLLDFYRRFLRSDCTECVAPGDWTRQRMSKAEARLKLAWLIDVAINRKAGVPDCQGRKQQPDYQTRLRRDQGRLQDMAKRIRVYQFETDEVRERFGHRLARHDD